MTGDGEDDRCLRVALVGVGPKGLFALERLLDHAHRAGPRTALHVDLFEPHRVAGAGPVYDPGQPAYLRMNLAAEHLNLWGDESRAARAGERRSFVEWRRQSGHEDLDERYPPRALIGRYLADGLATLRRAAPRRVTIALHRTAAHALRRRGSSWTIATSDGSVRDGYDEVLVATGHTTAGGEWARAAWPHAAPLIPAVFPVTRLAAEHVPPGASVAVRGFALTFLDAALALTEGRGGAFAATDHPYRLRYTPSRDDAGAIVPFSRTGRPMLAKPEAALAAGIPDLEPIARAARAQVLALPRDFAVRSDLRAILAAAVEASLLAADGGARPQSPTSAERWLGVACDGLAPPTPLSAVEEIERSLAVGAGLVAPDLPWALGQTWRALYPALVARLSHGGLSDQQRPPFRALAVQLERVAFGPPAVNAAKLLALIAAGRVDLAHVRGARLRDGAQMTVISSAGGERRVDVVVDAVLPQPGALRSDSGLLERLVADGHARIVEGGRGLQVGEDGGCIGAGGNRTTGLSAIGRPTEDWVIGNDTLSRTLHPHADAWALRVIGRAAREPVADAVGVQAA
jgi:diaminopimelate decarboxylase